MPSLNGAVVGGTSPYTASPLPRRVPSTRRTTPQRTTGAQSRGDEWDEAACARTGSVDHSSPRVHAVNGIFLHTVFTHARILSAFHLPPQFTSVAVFIYGRRSAAFSLPQHSNTPLFSHTVAFLQLFHSHSILTRRCSRIRSHFRCSFSQHSRTPLF